MRLALLVLALAACGSPVAINRVEAPTKTTEAGEPAPSFETTDHRGQPVSLAAALERGPTVLVFYRGHW